MRRKLSVLLLAAMLIGAILPASAGPETQLDSVMGIPWGASPEQGRKLMAVNGYSFVWDGTDAGTGSQVLEFKGAYASLPAYVQLFFMNHQMWQLQVRISDEEYGMDYAFDTINKLLQEKYGQISDSQNYNVYRNIPLTRYTWKLDGNTKTIKLSKFKTFYVDKTKMNGGASVTYENIHLYEMLKEKNI
ncbi:MAG: hypothetical protein AB9917_05945 [Negativicutes bacterium]